MTHALFPGSFDPPTLGHLDLILRASKMFDKITVAVLKNNAKNPIFSEQERVEMLQMSLLAYPTVKNVGISVFDGLTVRYAEKIGANVLLRGLRSAVDLEYEKTLAYTNASVAPEIETVFFLTDPAYVHVSSTIVRELASYQADFSQMVPDCLVDKIAAHFSK